MKSLVIAGLVLSCLGREQGLAQPLEFCCPKCGGRVCVNGITPCRPPMLMPAELSFDDYSPPGSVDGQGIFKDVMSRLSPQERSAARMSTRSSWCHEATHSLQNRIRNTMGGGYNSVYVGGGRCVRFREPQVTINQVMAYVPRTWPNGRKIEYPTHMAFGHWQRQPLYLLDEWGAYCCGTECAIEENEKLEGTDTYMASTTQWAWAVVNCVKDKDPGYQQLADLEAFVEWNEGRVEHLLGRINGNRPYNLSSLTGLTSSLTRDHRWCRLSIHPIENNRIYSR